jgi:hypothetical protein
MPEFNRVVAYFPTNSQGVVPWELEEDPTGDLILLLVNHCRCEGRR